jgi:hypothetical protein
VEVSEVADDAQVDKRIVAQVAHYDAGYRLEAACESIAAMIENQTERRRVLSPSSLFAIHFVEKSIHEEAV